MKIFPAIDLIAGQVVRLTKGDYNQKTVYSDDPVGTAKSFYDAGAEHLHIVDLDGAKIGYMPNFHIIERTIKESGLLVQTGGGIRTEESVKRYVDAGIHRVILGTAAVAAPEFLEKVVDTYGEKIAVGVDIKDGFVAIKGWTEYSGYSCFEFCERLEKLGVKTVICTDVSKDGMMGGANTELYKQLGETFNIDFIASGGVSSYEDIIALRDMGIYGAIVGRALYEGTVDLEKAVRLAGEEK